MQDDFTVLRFKQRRVFLQGVDEAVSLQVGLQDVGMIVVCACLITVSVALLLVSLFFFSSARFSEGL